MQEPYFSMATDKGVGDMKKVIIIGAAVLVLAGGGGAAFFMMQDDPPAEGVEGAAAPAEPEADPLYRPLSPDFVINFKHQGAIHYLQLSMQVMAYEEDVIDKVAATDPAIRNQLIMLFSGQDYEELGTLEGKEKLRQEVLVAVNEVIKMDPAVGVQDVYFTGFVMQ